MGVIDFEKESVDLFDALRNNMDPESESYEASLRALERVEALRNKRKELENSERKLKIEEMRAEKEGTKTKFEKVLDVAKVVAAPIASVITVAAIIFAEKKDDLWLGSKAMNKVPKP